MFELGGAEADAIPALRRAAVLCPDDPEAVRLRLANLLVKQGDLGEAEQNYRELFAREVGQAAAHLGLARIAVSRGDPAEAARQLQNCFDNPSVARAAYLLLAEVKQRLGDRPAAPSGNAPGGDVAARLPWPDPFLAELTAQKADTQRLYVVPRRCRAGYIADAQRDLEAVEGNHPATLLLMKGRRRLAAGTARGGRGFSRGGAGRANLRPDVLLAGDALSKNTTARGPQVHSGRLWRSALARRGL